MAEKVGRKTDLTEEVLAKIKGCILNGKTLTETASVCDIKINTLYRWSCDNYAELSDKIENWRRDYKLLRADKNIDKILDLDIKDKDFSKTVADMSKFVKETLDKGNYSKRTENTGKDGKDLQIQVVNFKKDEDNSST